MSIKIASPIGFSLAFVGLSETGLGFAVNGTTGWTQTILVIFMCLLALTAFGGFLYLLLRDPARLYPPDSFPGTSLEQYMKAFEGASDRPAESPGEISALNQPSASEIVDGEFAPIAVTEEIVADAEAGEPKPTVADLWAKHDYAGARELHLRHQDSEEDPKVKSFRRVWFEYMAHHRGDPDALANLEQLANEPETKVFAITMTGRILDLQNRPAAAAEKYELALSTASEEEVRCHIVALLAKVVAKRGQPTEAQQMIRSEIQRAQSPRRIMVLYSALAEIYADQGDSRLAALAFDRAASYATGDRNQQFDAAYKLSNQPYPLTDLAYLIYDGIPGSDEDRADVLNNLGVFFGDRDLKIREVDHYERAAMGKNSLATANLANQLVNAGFADTARSRLLAVKDQENVHPNVHWWLSEIEDRKTAENKKFDALVNTAQKTRAFFDEFEKAAWETDCTAEVWSGSWIGSEGTMSAVKAASEVNFSWREGETAFTATLKEVGCSAIGDVHSEPVEVDSPDPLASLFRGMRKKTYVGYALVTELGGKARLRLLLVDGGSYSERTFDRAPARPSSAD